MENNKFKRRNNVNLNDLPLKDITQKIVLSFQYSAVKVLLHAEQPAKFPLPKNPDAFENLLYKRYNIKNKNRIKSKVSSRTLQKYVKNNSLVDFSTNNEIINSIKLNDISKVKNNTLLNDNLEIISRKFEKLDKIQLPSMKDIRVNQSRLAQYKKLQYRINKVKCYSKTTDDLWGKDEIFVGGVALDALGNSKEISEYRIGSFKRNDIKEYMPPKVFHTFDLFKEQNWPRTYTIILALGEIDEGGFSEFLKDLIDKIIEIVKTEVSKWATTIATSTSGAIIGAEAGAIAGIIGAVIGALAGIIISLIADAIKNILKDDCFDPKQFVVELIAPTSVLDNGKTISDEKSTTFSQYGAKYKVYYDWCLLKD